MCILSHAIKMNPYLTHLNLESNSLSQGDKFYKITMLLKSNKILKSLNLSKCGLGIEDAEAISKGLTDNQSLTSLNLSKNKIMTKGATHIFESLQGENSKLQNLDLSSNSIESEAIESLIHTLEDNNVLKKLNLYNNMLSETIGRSLAIACKNNKSIQAINLSYNNLDKKDLIKIKEYCKRNIQNAEKIGLPAIRDELVHLMQTDEGITVTEDQILEVVKYSKKERKYLEEEFIKGQDKFDHLKNRQENQYHELLKTCKEVDEKIKELDQIESDLNDREIQDNKNFENEKEDLIFKIKLCKNQQK